MKLICSSSSPFQNKFSIDSSASLNATMLVLTYQITGPIGEVLLPDSSNHHSVQVGSRSDFLWKTTCFEAFFKYAHDRQYWEINLSPNGDWNCYHFSKYRTDMKLEPLVQAPLFEFRKNESEIFLKAEFDISRLNGSHWNQKSHLQVGLTSIIEDEDHNISYWALKHATSEPDFHNSTSFILNLNLGEV